MDAPTIAALAALAAALIAVVGLAAPVYLRLGHLEAEVKAGRERADAQHADLRERADAQHAETLAEIRRLTDALVSHSHTDGGIIFHIPPPSGSAQQE